MTIENKYPSHFHVHIHRMNNSHQKIHSHGLKTKGYILETFGTPKYNQRALENVEAID